jgi:hypothetical protein
MEVMLFIILVGVVLIDSKLWKVVFEQRRHNRAVEQLLVEMRVEMTGQPMFGVWRTLEGNGSAGDWWRGGGEDSPAASFVSREEAESKTEELARMHGDKASFEVRPLKGKE